VAPPPPPIAGPAICEPWLLLSFPPSLSPPSRSPLLSAPSFPLSLQPPLSPLLSLPSSPPVAAPAVCEPFLLPRRRRRRRRRSNLYNAKAMNEVDAGGGGVIALAMDRGSQRARVGDGRIS